MKKQIRRLFMVVWVVLSVGLWSMMFTGCASTTTSESTGEYLDNAAITTKVKSAYATDPVVKALSVHVSTFKGVVQLTGTVSSDTEKKRAEEIARSVAGVTKVKNGIVVKP